MLATMECGVDIILALNTDMTMCGIFYLMWLGEKSTSEESNSN